MKYLFLLSFLLACGNRAQYPTQAEITANHKRSCEAAGKVVISYSQLMGEDCEETTTRLNQLITEDEDCRAYFGGNPVKVGDVCN